MDVEMGAEVHGLQYGKLQLMPYELLLGLRYIRSGRSSRFVSFISALATVGIALGVAALIIVLSVMNGFQKEVRDRMLGVLSHLEVISLPDRNIDWPSVSQTLSNHPKVLATAPFVVGQAMLSAGDQIRGVMVRGVDPALEPAVSPALKRLVAGRLDALESGAFGLVMGRDLALALNLSLGDSVMVVTADPASGPAGVLPRMKAFKLVALFSSGHFEYDSSLVFVHQADASRFFRNQVTEGLRARLLNMHEAPFVRIELEPKVPAGSILRDWTLENRNWFAAVQIEKRMMFIILMLIIAVAAFNLVSMLVMTVMDKRSDIAILRTVGASRGSVMSIFVIQGAFLGLLGVGFGLLLGVLGAVYIDSVVATLEQAFGFQLLPKGIYLIERLPSDLQWQDVLAIGPTALVLSFLATLYPSWRASVIDPAEALRYD
jgi:lipoprotein-releasing system permease protein